MFVFKPWPFLGHDADPVSKRPGFDFPLRHQIFSDPVTGQGSHNRYTNVEKTVLVKEILVVL